MAASRCAGSRPIPPPSRDPAALRRPGRRSPTPAEGRPGRRRLAVLAAACLALLAAGCGVPPAHRLVVVFHTHPGEGYAGGGSVADVGAALAAALRAAGFRRVVHDTGVGDREPFAYLLARGRLLPYVWQRPALLLDVHRDDTTPGSYLGRVGALRVARVLFVVGRDNPFRGAAEAQARRLARVAAALYPGLLRGEGIYRGPGGYNQDLGADVVLVEVGNRDTPLADALVSAHLLARVIAAAYGADGR
jgi:stage II sporulation protein P